jgi:hypothetical protein
MKRSSGKVNNLKLLLNQDSGDYYDNQNNIRRGSGMEYLKTKCWRLVPKTNLNESDDPLLERNMPRYFSVDGERYPIGPIQVKVLQKTLQIFCLNK